MVIGVFHWGSLVGNYRFFEGREQCLQSQLGSVVVSRPVTVDWIGLILTGLAWLVRNILGKSGLGNWAILFSFCELKC